MILMVFLGPLSSLNGAILTIYADIYKLCADSHALNVIWWADLEEALPGDVGVEILWRAQRLQICAKHIFIKCRIVHQAHFKSACKII